MILETTQGKCILRVRMPEKSIKNLEYFVIVEGSFNEEKVDAVPRPRRTRYPYQQSRRNNSAGKDNLGVLPGQVSERSCRGEAAEGGKGNRRFPKLILKACLGFQMK